MAGDDFITVEELARRLGYEPKTVRNKMGPNGILPSSESEIPMARGYSMK
jgi:hypothetical protein